MTAEVPDVISVAELSRRLRRTTESVMGSAWVEGEIASLRRVASGHCYFSLKDEREDALVECVMYRFQAQRFLRHLVDGARVQLSGRATVWAPRGRLQFIAEGARPAGRGALLEALEKTKLRLQAEGLFDPARKRPLPANPRVVGVVTSAHGAAFHDICTVAHRRANVRIVLCAALVQGEGAPASLVRAVTLLSRLPGLDVIIVGRGGGANEDLMAFNDEQVVRCLAQLPVPVVSAVGHEVDVTLTDFVADRRAATPSEAAEIVVPDRAARLTELRAVTATLQRIMAARLSEDRAAITRLRAALSDPRFVIAERQQYLDELNLHLQRGSARHLRAARERVSGLSQRLLARHPRAVVQGARARLAPQHGALLAAMQLRLEERRGALRTASARLAALSPLTVLARGYAIATDAQGKAILAVEQVEVGEQVSLRLHRGWLRAEVTKIERQGREGLGGTE